MSLRSAQAGDKITLAEGWNVGTGDFSVGFWVKLISDLNASGGLFAVAAQDTDPGGFGVGGIDITDSGTQLESFSSTGTTNNAMDLSTGTWYWVVFSRASGTRNIRVFDDSTSTTPLNTDTTSFPHDFTVDHDTMVLGEINTGSFADAEFRLLKVVTGYEWTDAEARAESQDNEIQEATSTPFGAWSLADVSTGLTDLTGNGRTLTNTGFVNGASDPEQLAASGATEEALTADLTTGFAPDGIASVNVPSSAELATGFDAPGSLDAEGGDLNVSMTANLLTGFNVVDGDHLIIYVGGFHTLEAGFTADGLQDEVQFTNIEGELVAGASVGGFASLTLRHEAELVSGFAVNAPSLTFSLAADLVAGFTLNGDTKLGADITKTLRPPRDYVLQGRDFVRKGVRLTRTIVKDYDD